MDEPEEPDDKRPAEELEAALDSGGNDGPE
jgi:hypothetical protein